MSKVAAASDKLIEEATALADAVSDYGHFGEMAHALRVARRVARRELNDGVLAVDDADEARKRLGEGQKIVAMARELWVEARA